MKVKTMVTKTNYILTQLLLVNISITTHLMYKLYQPSHIIGELFYTLSSAAIFLAMIGIGLRYGEDAKYRALRKKKQDYCN